MRVAVASVATPSVKNITTVGTSRLRQPVPAISSCVLSVMIPWWVAVPPLAVVGTMARSAVFTVAADWCAKKLNDTTALESKLIAATRDPSARLLTASGRRSTTRVVNSSICDSSVGFTDPDVSRTNTRSSGVFLQ